MDENELLDSIDELELVLYSSHFNDFLKCQNENNKANLGEMRSQLSSYRAKLQIAELTELAEKLITLGPQLKIGMAELQLETKRMNDIMQTKKMLSNVIGLVAKLLI